MYSGLSVISSPPRSAKVYISFITISVSSPIGRENTSVNSKIGVAISCVAVAFGYRARGADDGAETPHRRGQEILGTADRLQSSAQEAAASAISAFFFSASISAAFFSTIATRWSTMS